MLRNHMLVSSPCAVSVVAVPRPRSVEAYLYLVSARVCLHWWGMCFTQLLTLRQCWPYLSHVAAFTLMMRPTNLCCWAPKLWLYMVYCPCWLLSRCAVTLQSVKIFLWEWLSRANTFQEHPPVPGEGDDSRWCICHQVEFAVVVRSLQAVDG